MARCGGLRSLPHGALVEGLLAADSGCAEVFVEVSSCARSRRVARLRTVCAAARGRSGLRPGAALTGSARSAPSVDTPRRARPGAPARARCRGCAAPRSAALRRRRRRRGELRPPPAPCQPRSERTSSSSSSTHTPRFRPRGSTTAAVADADQPADRQADRVEELAHLAVAAFGDHHAVPVVGAFAATVLDALEGRRLAVDLDAAQQLVALPRRSSVPSTRTAYSRSTPKRGCISWLASSPEVVKSSRPSVLMSRRPTDCHLPCCSRGSGGTRSGAAPDRHG